MIVTTKKLFEAAYGKYAIGAYNINNLEQTMGLFQGCVDSKAPFIIQISKGARSYTHKMMLEGLIRSADEVFPDAIFAVHLDHGDEETCYDCIKSGFYSSVMIDASGEAFETNIATTRRVVEAAHARGIVVEAELGQLGGVEEHVAVSEANAKLTDPDQAKEFVDPHRVSTHWPAPSAPAMAPLNSAAPRACALTCWPRSRSACRVSRWSCTAPARCLRMRSPASMPPAAS